MPQWLLPLVALLAFAAGAAWINSSSDRVIPLHGATVQQAPNIPVQMHSDHTGEAKVAGNDQGNDTKAFLAAAASSQAGDVQTKANAKAANGAEDSTEWWVVLGHRLKITDTILALFTALLFFAAIWQGYQLKRTVGQTRESIELSRNSFIIENRAYVTPIEMRPDKILDANTGRVAAWRFTPQWRNTGQTPARRVRHLTNGKLFTADGMPPDFDFPDNQRNGPDRTIGRTIGPSFTLDGPECQIDATIFRDIMKRHRFFIWAWVEYRDVFSITPIRRSEWCVELVVIGDLTDSRVDAGAAFRLASTSRFNGTDEDCHRKAGEEAPLLDLDNLAPKEAGLPRLVMTHSVSFPWPYWPDPAAEIQPQLHATK